MKLNKKILALSLMGLMLFSTGCGSSNKTAEGKVIDAALDADPTTIDPQKGSDIYGNIVVINTMEPLLRLKDGKEEGTTEIEKAGASDYKVSADGLTYTFTIRDGLKWEDGKDLTAKDYEYGIKRTADPKTGAESAFLLEPIKNFKKVNDPKSNTPVDQLGVKAIDDKTLEIKLEKPTSYFLELVPYRTMYPQRKDLVDKFGDKYGSEKENYLACGPYKVAEWTHGSKIVLEKNDSYWNKDGVKNDKVNLKIMSDPTAVYSAFENNEVFKCTSRLPEWVNKFKKDDSVDEHLVPLPTVDYLALNHKDKLLSNKKIRQALLLALDRKGMNEAIFKGLSGEAEYWVPKAISIDGINYREKAGNPMESLRKDNPDPKKLLIDGMKELGLGEDPSKVEINFICTNSPIVKKYAEFIQQNYHKALGINVKLEMMEWPVLAGKVNKGDYQVGYLAWTADYDDPNSMLSLFKSNSGAVNTGWKNAEFDALLSKASESKDINTSIDDYKKAEKILIDDAVVVPITDGKSYVFNKKFLKGSMYNLFSTMGYQTQYIEKK